MNPHSADAALPAAAARGAVRAASAAVGRSTASAMSVPARDGRAASRCAASARYQPGRGISRIRSRSASASASAGRGPGRRRQQGKEEAPRAYTGPASVGSDTATAPSLRIRRARTTPRYGSRPGHRPPAARPRLRHRAPRDGRNARSRTGQPRKAVSAPPSPDTCPATWSAPRRRRWTASRTVLGQLNSPVSTQAGVLHSSGPAATPPWITTSARHSGAGTPARG